MAYSMIQASTKQIAVNTASIILQIKSAWGSVGWLGSELAIEVCQISTMNAMKLARVIRDSYIGE